LATSIYYTTALSHCTAPVARKPARLPTQNRARNPAQNGGTAARVIRCTLLEGLEGRLSITRQAVGLGTLRWRRQPICASIALCGRSQPGARVSRVPG